MYSLRLHPFFECGEKNPDLLNLYTAVMEAISWLGDSTTNLNEFKSYVNNDSDFFIQKNAKVLTKGDITRYFNFWDRNKGGRFTFHVKLHSFLFITLLGLSVASGVFMVRKGGGATKLSTIAIMDDVCTQMSSYPRQVCTSMFNSQGTSSVNLVCGNLG